LFKNRSGNFYSPKTYSSICLICVFNLLSSLLLLLRHFKLVLLLLESILLLMLLIHRLLLLENHLLLLLPQILLLKLLIIVLGGICSRGGAPWCNKSWLLCGGSICLRLVLDRMNRVDSCSCLSLLILLIVISIILHLITVLVTITRVSIRLLIIVSAICSIRIIRRLRISIVLYTITHWHLVCNHILWY
jgi:hypothetical protein